MKKICFVFIMFIIWSVAVFASANGTKSIDLREYQQSLGTINIMAASFEGAESYLGTFNYGQTLDKDKIKFYQGVCIVDSKNNEKLYPLMVKKIKGDNEQISEVILDKKSNMIYKQDFRKVQTNSEDAIAYQSKDTGCLKLLGKFKVITSAGDFDDCIGIEIYNKNTGEAMVQYLAKGYGVVYIEGVKSDGSKVEIAGLKESRSFNDEDVEWFKKNYFI